jgi:hypothetical protein
VSLEVLAPPAVLVGRDDDGDGVRQKSVQREPRRLVGCRWST